MSSQPQAKLESRVGFFKIKDGKAVCEFKVQKWQKDAYGDRHIVGKPTMEDVPVEQLGFVKELECFAVFVREAVSTATLLPMKAYFQQKLKVSIPNRKKKRYTYLMLEQNQIYLRNFASDSMLTGVKAGNVTSSVSLGSVDDEEVSVVRLGKPQKISRKTFETLKKEPTFVGLYRDESLKQELLEF